MKKTLVALLGMPGSGKTEAVNYLQEKYQWPKVYFGQITLDEVARLGLPLTPQNEQKAREGLRDRHGEDYYAQEVMRRVEALDANVSLVLLESFYSWAEYQVIKPKYGERLILIAIHAAPTIRYARLKNRPGRPLSEEEARTRDVAQLERFSQGSPIALADYMVVNEGNVEDFHAALDDIINKL